MVSCCSTNHSFPRFRPWSCFLGGQIHPSLFSPPLRESWLTGRAWGCWCRSFIVLLSVHARIWSQTVAVSLVGSSLFRSELCRLVVVAVAVDIVVLICSSQRCWDRGLNIEALFIAGSTSPHARRTSLRDRRRRTLPRAVGADPHYHIVRSK